MKNWRLAMMAAAAALSLQACDVQVHSGSTKVQEPQAALPDDTQLHGQPTAAAPAAVDTAAAVAPAPAEPAVQPMPEAVSETIAQAAPEAAALTPPASDTTAQAQVPPDTAALGAAGTTPPDATVPGTTGVAAPTELQRFFDANSPAAKAEAKAEKATAKR